MQTKTRVFLLLWGVTLCALGFMLQVSCSRNKAKENEVALKAEPEAVVNEASNATDQLNTSKDLPPEIKELNAQQKELAVLSDDELLKEEDKLNSMMQENDLMDRMNKKIATDNEKAHGKKILIRLALIRVEKSKRAMPMKKAQAE